MTTQLRAEAEKYKNKSANSFIRLDFYKEILDKTQWLDSLKPQAKFRLMCYIDKITKVPSCEYCDEITTIEKSYKKTFNKYCSDKCRIESKLDHPILSSKEWLYHERVEEHKSIESIAKECKCSLKTVKLWLNNHNIGFQNYSKSKSIVLDILENKKSLYDLYQNHDIRSIASLIGSSNYVVWKYLKIHNIEAKPSNSYPRKINKVSSEETELYDFIVSIYPGKVIQSDRSILNGKELDIYLPEVGIAFEYNGIYWHNETKIHKNKHIEKSNVCRQNNIILYHIFSDDWNLKNPIWKNRIRHLLKLSESVIYARKCNTKTITPQLKNKFLNENHLQGEDRSTYKYGLYSDNILVSVMTFAKARFNKSMDYELVRFAIKGNTSVVGGFSKLLSCFRKEHTGSIVSYSDNSYSNGDVYSSNGFKETKVSGAGYKYTKNYIQREHRLNFTKAKLRKRFNQPFKDMTEKQICQTLGYVKVWDCGTSTYILKSN